MTGGGAYLTPTFSGKVLFSLNAWISNDTANQGGTAALRWGTGTKPGVNVSVLGTQVGSAPVASFYAANSTYPISLMAVVTGLTVGTRYWFDASYGTAGGAGKANLGSLTMCGAEIP